MLEKIPVVRKLVRIYKKYTNAIKNLPHLSDSINNINYKIENINYLMNVLARKEIGKDLPYTFLNHLDIVKKLVSSEVSLVRFGDGEIIMMHGHNNVFQTPHPLLAKKLQEVHRQIPFSESQNFIVGVNDGIFTFYKHGIDRKDFYNRYNYSNILNFLQPHNTYYSGSFARLNPYEYSDYFEMDVLARYEHNPLEKIPDFKDTAEYYQNDPVGQKMFAQYMERLINPLKSIWKDRNVIIVEGEKSAFGLYNDLFDNVASIHRVFGPAFNAFSAYEKIKQECLNYAQTIPNPLFIFSLGPTATVLAYEIHKETGYRCLDLGNMSLKYDIITGQLPSDQSIDSPDAIKRNYKK